ncbi:hypothetical protein D9615_009526 [Tricholomella constricta]|uniref:DUF6699 domain-containing protein n=1 Tax=Tricholomella constricta TaxID=117010 RepID=A0A8H5GW17_9AGAR|nr:hypothetical protein D9615_009526 [Tricholomella constricta]
MMDPWQQYYYPAYNLVYAGYCNGYLASPYPCMSGHQSYSTPVVPPPAYQPQWPHTPTTPMASYDPSRPRMKGSPRSPEPVDPYHHHTPPSSAVPYWDDSDEEKGNIAKASHGATWANPAHRRASGVLRRKSSSFHTPCRTRFARIWNPLRSRRKSHADGWFSAEEASFDSLNLAPRPDSWRIGYRSPHLARRLSRSVSRTVRTAVVPKEDPYNLSPLLCYSSPSLHPLRHDLRQRPSFDIRFLNLKRPANEIDFHQLATSPPVNELCLYHPRLPWYIYVRASRPNGVTIEDIFTQIHQNLGKQVRKRDFYNEALSTLDREELSRAFHRRGGPETGDGVLRMDFLGSDMIFLGLAKSKHGLWEIKTAEAER